MSRELLLRSCVSIYLTGYHISSSLHIPSSDHVPLVSKRRVLNAQTTFLFADSECRSSQQVAIVQANKDALELTNAAFDTRSDELPVNPINWMHKYVNFNTQAAVDCFGPLKLNLEQRQRIYDTFYRATDVYRS
jgi:hypothetical protein